MARRKNIETDVAEAVLEKPEQVTIGDKTYDVAPPSLATLIMVSEIISTFPKVESEQTETQFNVALRTAKDFFRIGELLAVLILGAKEINKPTSKEPKKSLNLFGRKKEKQESTKTELERLSQDILENVSPSRAMELLIRLLYQRMEVTHFFGITTSLSGVNLLTPTKEVEKS